MAKKNILSITEIEDRLKMIVEKLNKSIFIEDFLALFDIPKTSITRARSSKGDFLIRNKVRYRTVESEPLQAIDEIEQEIFSQNKKPRYIITTDFEMLYAKDTKTNDSLAIKFEDLPKSAAFFLAWNGIEKVDFQKENLADIKAAERFTKLYDELIKINPELAEEETDGKSFNLFLIRSLFLFFAEDTDIIAKGSFTNVLKTRTKDDGSNLNAVIKDLFSVLDISENQRYDTAEWLRGFPYVNGKLFKEPHHDLVFNTFTRKLLIEAGELLKWNEINPDILGAMIQTVANKEERQVSGMHYTSVSNIMKVIKPLFLEDIQTEYQRLVDRADDYLDRKITEEQRRKQQRDVINQLKSLIDRMSKIKFLDPACGSGNFLIITYKELRRIEIDCLIKIRQIREYLSEKDVHQGSLLKESRIKLSQFSGIELDEFAHEVAYLSLYIAQHQMNVEMTAALADYQPHILPLQEAGNIVCDNALRIDWGEVVGNDDGDEVYVMGNPPYIGSKKQNDYQKNDMDFVFGDLPSHRNLDYITCWFYKLARYLESPLQSGAFVTTDSITQGEQVGIFWGSIFQQNCEINFAYKGFKWKNSAKNNAGVNVAIIGISRVNQKTKKIYLTAGNVLEAKNITPYLSDGKNILVSNRSKPLSNIPEIYFGNMPNDGNGLVVELKDYVKLKEKNTEAIKWLRKYMGGDEFIKGTHRYAIWLNQDNYIEATKNPFIASRVEITRQHRLRSKDPGTNKLAHRAYQFRDTKEGSSHNIIIPANTSSERQYVPMGLIEPSTIISNLAYVIYDAPIWLLGVLESRMMMNWLKGIGGKIGEGYRFSKKTVYNTFPVPNLSESRKNILEEAVFEMLDVREEEGGTLAELYGGANKPMNARLREAHEKIDGIVERAYKQEPFKSDEERLGVLLNLYQEIVGKEKK